jgi:DNA polymerase-1
MLSRFHCQGPENQIEEYFKKENDFSKMEELFAKGSEADHVGFSLIIQDGQLLGCALCFGEKDAWYFPVEGFVSETYLAGKVEELLKQGKAAATLNLKEQLSFLDVPNREKVDDLAIAAYLLNPLKDTYTYEDIAKEHLGLMVPSKTELLGKKGFAETEKEEAVSTCACYIAYVAWAACEPLKKKLEEEQMMELYRQIEMPLIYTLYDMEQAGIRVQADALKAYGEQLSGRITELETEIYEQAGEKFNINSPKQLGVILFEKLQLPNGKKTKTGYSTAADVLEKLAGEYPIVSSILEYRQLAKLKSTYADGLAAYIGPDERIHSTFNQTITATGRISSAEPNLQNIPIRMELGRLIRKVFIPKDGYVFVDADYSQIELRVLAAISGDETLIQAYREAQDIHRITASQVFHIPFDEVTDLQRRNAKAVNFGIVYGISSFGLSQDLSISRKEASQYIEKYFETYPGIKKFLDDAVTHAKENGYVTTIFGRRRPMPELKSSNFMQRSFGERVAMNAPIQGTAADIIKIAMVRVNERLKAEGRKSRLILQIHDELLIEAKESEVEEVKKILLEEMQGAAHLAVNLEIDMHTGKNWYEAK